VRFLTERGKHTLYPRIVVTVFVILALAVGLSSVGYYFLAKAAILDQQEQAAQRDLVQISYSERLVAELARASAAQVFSDPAMARLLFFSETDVHTLSTGLSRLDRFRWNNPHIHSMLLYNARTGVMYVSADEADHAVQNLDTLFDPELARLFRTKSPQELDLALFSREMQVRTSRTRIRTAIPVLTLVYFANHSTLPADRFSAVVVNVSESWIRETLDALNQDKNYRINVLVPTIDGQMSSFLPHDDSELPETVLGSVLATTDRHARLVIAYDGQREIVNVHNPDFTQWRFFTRSDYRAVMEPLRRFGHVSMLVAAALLVLAIAAALYGSSRIYKPVRRISEDLRSLEELHLQERRKLQMETFHNLLKDPADWPDDVLLKTLADFEILPDLTGPAHMAWPLLVRSSRAESDVSSARTRSQHPEEWWTSTGIAETFSVRVLTSAPHESLLLLVGAARESLLVRTIASAISSNATISVVVGPAAHEPYDLPAAFRATIELSAQLYTLGSARLLTAGDAPSLRSADAATLDRLEQETAAAILDGNWEASRAAVIQFRTALEGVSPVQARSAVMSLVHRLQEVVQTVRAYYHHDYRGYYYQIHGSVQQAQSIWEAETRLLPFVRAIVASIARDRSSRQKVVADRITEIIRRDFADPNLYVQSIADTLHLSAPYLGRIYRQQTGHSIPNAISEVRVEKACELLAGSDAPIESIAEQVGFSSKTYFHRVFKRLIGATPRTYRESRQTAAS
jgi:AraC-like DNA-binding protein